jgi:formylglycine-generating enzyme required for sulfatase activity
MLGNPRFYGTVVAGAGRRDRVLRGGAFNNNQNNVRCAYRRNNNPNNRNTNNGFRIIVSHILLD